VKKKVKAISEARQWLDISRQCPKIVSFLFPQQQWRW
jgi:hypothetical protein